MKMQHHTLLLVNVIQNVLKLKKNLTSDEIKSRGGNSSMIHIDWMIGSGKIDVSGKDQDGNMVPIFKQGEWCN